MIFSFFVVRSDFMTWLFFIAKVNRISAKTNNKVSMYKLQFKNNFFFEGGGISVVHYLMIGAYIR